MPNAIFVVFSSPSDPDNLFREAFGSSWDSEFGKKDLVFRLPAENSWDVAMVWEPDGIGGYKTKHKSEIKERLGYLREASRDMRCVGIILHAASTAVHQTQRELIKELVGDSRTHKIAYTRQKGNLIYRAVADVIKERHHNDASASPYREALRNLFSLVCSPYDLAIDILTAFLPADLEWQITTGEKAKECLPQLGEMQNKYKRFKELAREHGTTTDFKEVDKQFAQIFQDLPEEPEAFHGSYITLRDALLAIVEAAEPRGGEDSA